MTSTKSASKSKPFTVAIEGNIGSGKTTFLNYFGQYSDICVLEEPIAKWRDCAGHNLLGHMYEDVHRWGFTFQSYVQLTMLQQHMFKTSCPIKLMERSIYSARYCFVEKFYRDGILPPVSMSVLNEWFKWVTEAGHTKLDLIVYLKTTPEVVYKRMLKRNRQEEKSVSLEYLQEVHEMHENWLYHKTMFTCSAPVIVLNADLDETTITEEYEKYKPCIMNQTAIEVPS